MRKFVRSRGQYRKMTDDEIQRVINELKEWAGEEYGGQAELARKLGVSRQRVNDWLTGKRTPELNAWLKIQTFLRKKRRKRAFTAPFMVSSQDNRGDR